MFNDNNTFKQNTDIKVTVTTTDKPYLKSTEDTPAQVKSGKWNVWQYIDGKKVWLTDLDNIEL